MKADKEKPMKKVKASDAVKRKTMKLGKSPTASGKPEKYDDAASVPEPITPEAARGGYTVVKHNEPTKKPRKRSA